ncbi:TrmO family methyltransferase [Streptomyces sp. NPDC020792]|uniref:TrmO family methyltransferase domain-containing protein n=1 Tax=Streptomyces sp. NPDC020792 TaxID=3365089 RepID=UPI0037B08604
MGVTSCALESVHGRELTVVGLDAVSGTPVIDLKPTMEEFRPVNIKQPEMGQPPDVGVLPAVSPGDKDDR